ncbi:MAG TPA: hypothetical protein VNF68_06510 [Candidatus Baltobacteraceae bacterium]|nr:hypothetical protein [Candidatus Baltobacteraceae bacterium]
MRSLTAIFFALATTVATASASLDQTPGSNVAVTACSIRLPNTAPPKQALDARGQMTTSYTTTLGKQPGLTIGYTNEGKAAATEVDFDYVGHLGVVQHVTDTGTFASGKAILHRFPIAKNASILDLHGRCVVTRVKYADGSSWGKSPASGP